VQNGPGQRRFGSRRQFGFMTADEDCERNEDNDRNDANVDCRRLGKTASFFTEERKAHALTGDHAGNRAIPRNRRSNAKDR
jgi:hypothetical protein